MSGTTCLNCEHGADSHTEDGVYCRFKAKWGYEEDCADHKADRYPCVVELSTGGYTVELTDGSFAAGIFRTAAEAEAALAAGDL